MTNSHTLSSVKRKKAGFTLIEVIAVLVVLGILAAIALPRYIDLASSARERAIDSAISELNGRESLAWAQNMLETNANPVDATIFASVNATQLGNDWSWDPAPTVSGGGLEFQDGAATALTRTPSTDSQPAVWSRTP